MMLHWKPFRQPFLLGGRCLTFHISKGVEAASLQGTLELKMSFWHWFTINKCYVCKSFCNSQRRIGWRRDIAALKAASPCSAAHVCNFSFSSGARAKLLMGSAPRTCEISISFTSTQIMFMMLSTNKQGERWTPYSNTFKVCSYWPLLI